MKNITRKNSVHLGQADVSPSLFIYWRACFTVYASKKFWRRSRLFADVMRNDDKQVIFVVCLALFFFLSFDILFWTRKSYPLKALLKHL